MIVKIVQREQCTFRVLRFIQFLQWPKHTRKFRRRYFVVKRVQGEQGIFFVFQQFAFGVHKRPGYQTAISKCVVKTV